MNASNQVFALIKATDHAQEFLQGQLYCNRISWFRKNVDPKEGTIRWPLTDETVFKIDGVDIAPRLNDLTVWTEWVQNLNVFCLFALQPGPYLHETFDTDDPEALVEWNNYLKIDERFIERFGEDSVYFMGDDIHDFLRRVKTACDSKGYVVRMNFIDYISPYKFVDIPAGSPDWAFVKYDDDEYMKEFRIAIYTGTVGDDPLELDIGNIEDISKRIKTSEINDNISINFPQQEPDDAETPTP